jgi:hypothetical protein
VELRSWWCFCLCSNSNSVYSILLSFSWAVSAEEAFVCGRIDRGNVTLLSFVNQTSLF